MTIPRLILVFCLNYRLLVAFLIIGQINKFTVKSPPESHSLCATLYLTRDIYFVVKVSLPHLSSKIVCPRIFFLVFLFNKLWKIDAFNGKTNATLIWSRSVPNDIFFPLEINLIVFLKYFLDQIFFFKPCNRFENVFKKLTFFSKFIFYFCILFKKLKYWYLYPFFNRWIFFSEL